MFQKWTKEQPRISSPGSTQPCISEPIKNQNKTARVYTALYGKSIFAHLQEALHVVPLPFH